MYSGFKYNDFIDIFNDNLQGEVISGWDNSFLKLLMKHTFEFSNFCLPYLEYCISKFSTSKVRKFDLYRTLIVVFCHEQAKFDFLRNLAKFCKKIHLIVGRKYDTKKFRL